MRWQLKLSREITLNLINGLEITDMKNRILYRLSILSILAVAFNACMVGPNFESTEIQNPEKFRFQTQPSDSTSMLNWKNYFTDPVLTGLIDSALINNLDVQMAASRISEARAYMGMAKADMYPGITVGGGLNYGNTLSIYPSGTSAKSAFNITGNINWEIAFWGKYRRANEAARAELLASEYGMRAIQLSLISDVAHTYYTLLDYKKRLDIAQYTLKTRTESLRIIAERFDKGIVPEIDLNQAQIQESYAAAAIPVYKRSIAFAENALSLLIGENPKEIITNKTIDNLAIPKSMPVGLPSQLLERRPDILEAEQMVKAQNARIGVAQAMRFPSISLTGLLGMASADLSAFNASDALIGSVGAGLFGPVFEFGKNKRRVEMERERTDQLKLNYKKAVLSAFRETEDILITISTTEEELVFIEQQLKASTNATKLSRERYDGGVTSYLEVLEAERSLFNIELYHSELLQRRLTAYTDLYKTLGGGLAQ